MSHSARATAPPTAGRARGLLVCALIAAAAVGANHLLPTVSPLIIGLLAGVVWTNTTGVPQQLAPGLRFAARQLLRSGIVLLGLQIALADILSLGFGLIAVVVVGTTATFCGTLYVGKRLGIGADQRLLIAAGSSICGAAAVAGVDAAVEAPEAEVLNAVAVVTVFGSVAMGVVPLLGSALQLAPTTLGAWSGASIHEVAQVIAAAGTAGGAALSTAIVVKLTRVLMLAPMVAGVSIARRRSGAAVGHARPPIVPLFVAGFSCAVALRSTGVIPEVVLSVGKVSSTALLTAAMVALGTGVNVKGLLRSSRRSLGLGALAAVFISVITLAGVLTVG